MNVLFMSNADEKHPITSGGSIRHTNVLPHLTHLLNGKVLIIDNSLFYKSEFYRKLLKYQPRIQFKTFSYLGFLPYKLRIIYHILAATITGIECRKKFDVIMSDYTPGLLFPAILIKLFTKKKLIVSIQLLDIRHESLVSKAMKLSLRFANCVLVANSEYLKYIKHPHIYETFHAISPIFMVVPQVKKIFNICFVGSVENDRKGISKFINVAESLADQGLIKSALIITQSKTLSFLHTLISNQKLFTIRQNLNQKEVNYGLNESCLFLFPTQAESYGLVIGEAIKAGIPTVVSDIPEMKVWQDLAFLTSDYLSVVKFVLKNYSKVKKELMRKISSSKLLNMTWEKVAIIEANYINNL